MFEERASQHDDACGAISDFVVLTLGELDEQARNWVLDFHLLDDGGAVVGDGDFLVGRDEQLVESLGSEGGAESGCD